jgi:hypothetical protein
MEIMPLRADSAVYRRDCHDESAIAARAVEHEMACKPKTSEKLGRCFISFFGIEYFYISVCQRQRIEMLKGLYLSAALAIISHGAQAQERQSDCIASDVQADDNIDVQFSFSVRRGKTCVRNLEDGQMTLKDIQFYKLPRHGTLRRVGRFGYSYTANRGYTGPDSFTVRYIGERVDDAGNKAYDFFYGLSANVTVIP